MEAAPIGRPCAGELTDIKRNIKSFIRTQQLLGRSAEMKCFLNKALLFLM